MVSLKYLGEEFENSMDEFDFGLTARLNKSFLSTPTIIPLTTMTRIMVKANMRPTKSIFITKITTG